MSWPPKRHKGSETTTPLLGTGVLAGQDSDPWLYSVVVYPEIKDLQNPDKSPDPRIINPVSIIDEVSTNDYGNARRVVIDAAPNVPQDVVFANELQPQAGSQVTDIWTLEDPFGVIDALCHAVKVELEKRKVSFSARYMNLSPNEKPTIEVSGPGTLQAGQDLWIGGISLNIRRPGGPSQILLTRDLGSYVPHEV